MEETSVLGAAVEQVKGVGTRRASVLKEAGIHTLGDLLYYLPRRYLDRQRILPIDRVLAGQEVTLIGQVRQMRFVPGARPRFLLVVEDDSDDVSCVWFQGGRYLQRNFQEGDVLALSGKVELFQGRRQMVHPEYEFVSAAGEQALLHTGGIVPLYTASADMQERGLRSRGFRRLVHGALEAFADQVEDPLDLEMRTRLQLPDLAQSLRQVHFPASLEEAHRARRRLVFDELLAVQLLLLRRREKRRREALGIAFAPSQKLVPALLKALPFELTGAQQRVVEQIVQDMGQPVVMSRLLQGDVGSGKTLVALCAMLTAVDNGYQAALMAPTEILAEQHFFNIRDLVRPLGLDVAFLAGGQKAAQRRQSLAAIESGLAALAVGTHALIQEEVTFQRLGLVVVDEQHRFGVTQRGALYGKGEKPDLLVMTATPIPRSLALTLYGDLDVAVLDELPPGRQPIRTALRGEDRRELIFAFAAEQMHAGRQVYIVYPLIEESEKMDLKSAVEAYEELRSGPLAEFSLGLLHGRLASEEKAQIMEAFKEGQLQGLVSTTVIEVGVDVPNATLMIIEHAERFGLAQLHQLRGRVGRGGEQSFCILVTYASGDQDDSDAAARLQSMCQTQDGFIIAQRDMEIRGPGELLGTRQAGMPEFKVADLVRDADLLVEARTEAERIIAAENP
ncbi:MAG: ATP-dependent DNA helicase RecG [Candidatus Latescibacteria bacterium]|nr:ATP-dependent DNA helicase RecG [Candidatus Latescibacterota bacterium]